MGQAQAKFRAGGIYKQTIQEALLKANTWQSSNIGKSAKDPTEIFLFFYVSAF